MILLLALFSYSVFYTYFVILYDCHCVNGGEDVHVYFGWSIEIEPSECTLTAFDLIVRKP